MDDELTEHFMRQFLTLKEGLRDRLPIVFTQDGDSLTGEISLKVGPCDLTKVPREQVEKDIRVIIAHALMSRALGTETADSGVT